MTASLVAAPVSILTWEFILWRGEDRVGRIRHRAFRGRSFVVVDGVDYDIRRQRGVWRLYREGESACIAEIASARGLRLWRLTWDTHAVDLARKTALGGIRAEVWDGGESLGTVASTNLFTRKIVADLSDRMPLDIQAAVVWFLVMLRRRAVG